jgi:hypothetical protein
MRQHEDIKAIEQILTKDYAIYLGDSCELIRAIPGDSIHFGIHSPPFESLYKFSNSDRDISNNEGAGFWAHYQFLIQELLRVTMPGRLHAVHVMQLPMSKIRHGHIGMRDFRGDVVKAYCGDDADEIHGAIQTLRARRLRMELAGDTDGFHRLDDLIYRLESERDEAAYARGKWVFHSEVCIWKDPVVAQQRTKSLRLLHKQIVKDSAMSGQGLADFIVTFRKPGENPEPVSGGFSRYVGSAQEPDRAKYTTPMDGRNWYSIEVWQRYASPVWMDINQTRTLQYRGGRDEKDEVHISPLQLDVIERCIDLWSNPGDVVLTPFLGIGSEVYCAVNMGRKGIGFELKPSYFVQAVKNIAELHRSRTTDLFASVAAE